MIPILLDGLSDSRLFAYITFRMAMAGLTAFLLAIWWGGITLRWLKSVSYTHLTLPTILRV